MVSAVGIVFRRDRRAAAAGCDPTARECREKQRHRLTVISDYESSLSGHALYGQIRDVSELPHAKADILEAILLELVRENDRSRRMLLESRALMLACFQERPAPGAACCVNCAGGELTVTAAESAGHRPATEGAVDSNPQIGDALDQRVKADMADIRIRIQGALSLRRKLPERLVHRILG
jgi:hypothetical protein